MSCLTNFTAPELLMGNNKITCENCTKIHSQLHGGQYEKYWLIFTVMSVFYSTETFASWVGLGLMFFLYYYPMLFQKRMLSL